MASQTDKTDRQTDRQNPSPYRILLLGDSFSWGLWGNVKEEDRFSELLRKMLGNKVEIINAGVPGYCTAQEYLYYVTEGYKYKPNMIILQFFGNDFMENMGIGATAAARPVYTINKSGQRIPVRIAILGEGLSLSQKLIKKVEPLRVWLNYNSSLYNFLLALYNKAGILNIWCVRYTKRIDVELTLELIKLLKAKAKVEGVDRFIVAIAPLPDIPYFRRAIDYGSPLISTLIRFLITEGIPYIYPQEEFIQNQFTFYNIPEDVHFSVEGNKRFAEHLYKLVLSLEPSLARLQ